MKKFHKFCKALCAALRELYLVTIGVTAFGGLYLGHLAENLTGIPDLCAIGFAVGTAVGVYFCKWEEI